MNFFSTNKKTIVLLVDEAEVILKSIEMVLNQDGFRVHTVRGKHYPNGLTMDGPRDSLGVIRYVRENVSRQTEVLLVSCQ